MSATALPSKAKNVFQFLQQDSTHALKAKRVLIFDMDGTLTESRMGMDTEMAELLCSLLRERFVAVMSGAHFHQFEWQFLDKLSCPQELLPKLYIFPTSGSRMYEYVRGAWQPVYEKLMTESERKMIFEAFEKAFVETNYVHPTKVYGDVIDDRGSAVTFSAVGQQAPLDVKKIWVQTDPRAGIQASLVRQLPDYEIKTAGLTSIDVTQKGINKAFGVLELAKKLNVTLAEMLYIGDALHKGGNDEVVLESGIDAVQVGDIDDTKFLIRACLGS